MLQKKYILVSNPIAYSINVRKIQKKDSIDFVTTKMIAPQQPWTSHQQLPRFKCHIPKLQESEEAEAERVEVWDEYVWPSQGTEGWPVARLILEALPMYVYKKCNMLYVCDCVHLLHVIADSFVTHTQHT